MEVYRDEENVAPAASKSRRERLEEWKAAKRAGKGKEEARQPLATCNRNGSAAERKPQAKKSKGPAGLPTLFKV